MVGRRHIDMSGLNRSAILSEGYRMLPAAQQARKRARVGANVHDDKDRRPAGNRQRRNDLPERIKSTRRSRNNHNAVHSASLTP